jgi:ferritin-like metal-binding protein YciE
MKADNLKDLLVLKLKALYDVENQIIKALPKMAKKATNKSLKAGFEKHLKETKGQVNRLEKVFKLLGEKPRKTKVEAIRGLVKDGEWVMKNVKPAEALDANLVAAAQYVEHYEMAGYGTASEWASQLGEAEVVNLLEETLEEEKKTDQTLSTLAMSEINQAIA